MTRTRLIVLTGALGLFAIACDRTEVTAPLAAVPGASLARNDGSCVVDVGETVRPLPAVHVLAAWINISSATPGSSLTCGQVRSLDAKLETVAKALDQNPQNYHAACGVSGALLSELTNLIEGGQLAALTFPEPAPGAPTTVLGVADETNASWCAAARGELVGPQP